MSTEYSAIQQYYSINSYATGICALIFTILVSLDAYKAFKRKAHWIPSESLVLSALIIQLLTFIDNLNLNVNSNDKDVKDQQIFNLIANPLRLNIRRVMICIFISYLLPGVVRSGLRTVWGDIGALALTVLWHMTYEVYFLLKVIKEETPSTYVELWRQCKSCRMWFTVSYFTFFTAFVLLVVLLTCAVIAGKTIRNMISQKVPLALSCCSSYPEKQECHNIENHVLKCWVVNRATQPDYIMARSVFVSFAGLVSTVCFVLLVATWAWEVSRFLRYNIVTKLTYLMRLIFILIGWIVLLYRWFTAVMYFPRGVQRLFHMEDFWTRSIVDMKNDVDAYSAPGLFREKRKLERAAIESIVVNLITTFRLNALLFITVLWLQKLIVSVSKACWCLSELPFRLIRPFIMSREKNALLCGSSNASVPKNDDQFHHYKEALDIIRMPGEIAYSLWIANLSAFKKAVNNMEKGYEDGKSNAAEFITLMGYKKGTVEDEIPTLLAEEKHFQEVGKSTRKMTAVSFIHFMMYFYDGTNDEVIDDSFKAYSQAQSFMDIVDSLDLDGHLASLAADKEFDTIRKIWSSVNPSNKELLEEKIRRPLKQLMEQCDREERTATIECQEDSRDWMAVAAKISLYKVWKTMDPYKSTSVTAIDHLRSLLANLIAHCMEKELDAAVINNCRKWVQEGREKQIFDAAFIAGKAKAVREEIEGSPPA